MQPENGATPPLGTVLSPGQMGLNEARRLRHLQDAESLAFIDAARLVRARVLKVGYRRARAFSSVTYGRPEPGLPSDLFAQFPGRQSAICSRPIVPKAPACYLGLDRVASPTHRCEQKKVLAPPDLTVTDPGHPVEIKRN